MGLRSLGLSGEERRRTFCPGHGTLKNIERSGSVQALTGPISRGDLGTVEQHLRALAERLPEYLDAYRALGLLTVALAEEKKSLAPKGAQALRRVLTDREEPRPRREKG
jgi:hypothetical protein